MNYKSGCITKLLVEAAAADVSRGEPYACIHPLILSHQLEQMLQVNARFAGVSVYQSGNSATAIRF